MSLGELIVRTIYNAAQWPAFKDAPGATWRDAPDRDCIDRVCVRHESCARREAFCTFIAWYGREVRVPG